MNKVIAALVTLVLVTGIAKAAQESPTGGTCTTGVTATRHVGESFPAGKYDFMDRYSPQ